MIKTYEGFFSELKEKFPQNKLAKAFVNLFKSINPNLDVFYKHHNFDNNVISIQVKKEHIITLLYIHCSPKIFKDSLFEIEPFFDMMSIVDLPNNIDEFIKNIFNSSTEPFRIKENKIPEIISKLKIENYNIFNDSEKYNL